MREIDIIVGKAKSGKSYFAYHSISEKIRKNNGVLTLDFYKDSSILSNYVKVDSAFAIANMDYIIRNFDNPLNRSTYQVVIFDGIDQLINQVRKEISYVIPSNHYFDNSNFVDKYIKLKIYEWISSLLIHDIKVVVISNLNCFDNYEDMSNFTSLVDIFRWEYYDKNVKVRKYETYIDTLINGTEGYLENKFWVRNFNDGSKEENWSMDALIKELNEGKC